MQLLFRFFCFFLLTSFFVSAKFTSQDKDKYAKVKRAIQTFENDPVLSNVSWGFCAKSVYKKEVIATHNANRSLIPASTLKVITTATALTILGENFTFKTRLAHDGFIDGEGVLHGNLYITGGGDPTLGLSIDRKNLAPSYKELLNKWVNIIKQKGIREISGYVIGDATFFEEATTPQRWLWEDIGNYYGAGPSALSFNENFYEIAFSSGKAKGQKTTIKYTIPNVPELTLLNRVTTGPKGSGDRAYIYGAPYNEVNYIRGTIPPNKKAFTIKGAVPDPAFFCSNLVYEALKKNGISTKKGATTVRKLKIAQKYRAIKRNNFHVESSPPLKDIVYWTNKKSINLYAENLLKMIGKQQYGVGSVYSGLRGVKDFWKARGVDLKGFFMYDGSGLSPTNAITPTQFVDILSSFTSEPEYYALYKSLPIAGNSKDDSFLKTFMSGTAAANNMRVKSGTIANTRAFTGYVYTKSKDLVAFSIIVNQYTCSSWVLRQKIQQVLRTLATID